MNKHFSPQVCSDPGIVDWANLELPDTWADQLNLKKPRDLLRFFARVLSARRQRVLLPDDMPGLSLIPRYVLQEFHRIPNGNYSKRITRGYITGFEHMMLGNIQRGRDWMADQLRHCKSVLDVGCAGGKTGGTLAAKGVADVWGLDPSPYLLKHAARDFPQVNFVQGVAENTGFGNERFDAVTACFLFHEIPPRYLKQALAELCRILKPGGRLLFCEPSPRQAKTGLWRLMREYGWRGLYFGWFARFVYEPFLLQWHNTANETFFRRCGFSLETNIEAMPLQMGILRKV